jgi:hypothetical protein
MAEPSIRADRAILNELNVILAEGSVTNGTLEVRSSTSVLVYYYDTQRRIPENLATAMTRGHQIP